MAKRKLEDAVRDMKLPSTEPGTVDGHDPHTNLADSGEPPKASATRSVKSFRMRNDLSYRIEVLAAQERRKIYEVVEEALEQYLARREQASV